MRTYNKIMQYFWLLMAIAITAFVTYKGSAEGFDRWSPIYIFAALALVIFLLRRFMMKKVERHYANPLKDKKK